MFFWGSPNTHAMRRGTSPGKIEMGEEQEEREAGQDMRSWEDEVKDNQSEAARLYLQLLLWLSTASLESLNPLFLNGLEIGMVSQKPATCRCGIAQHHQH